MSKNRNLQILADLLAFELRNADRHNLPEVRITKARARTILEDLRAELSTTKAPSREPKFFNRLDTIHA